MREIPKLQTLCLRVVGSQACSAEKTFARKADGTLSSASKLLRSFHKRPCPRNQLRSKVTSSDGNAEHGESFGYGNEIDVGNEGGNGDDSHRNQDGASASANQGPSMKQESSSSPATSSATSATSPADQVMMNRTPCIGKGSARREQANEVDLNHPIIGTRFIPNYDAIDPEVRELNQSNIPSQNGGSNSSSNSKDHTLVMEYGNPVLDCLQSFIDSLVELGRMDDARLGVNFCKEWKANVMLAHGHKLPLRLAGVVEETEDSKGGKKKSKAQAAASALSRPIRKKRRRTPTGTDATPSSPANMGGISNNAMVTSPISPDKKDDSSRIEDIDAKGAFGALSLHNCTLQRDTINAMVASGMGINLTVIDFSGVQGLSDDMMNHLLPHCSNLRRLSIKNCRRLTKESIALMGIYQTQLQCLDIGGSYNILPVDLINLCVATLPRMEELHASGLAWTNPLVHRLCGLHPWKALSLGFTQFLTAGPLRDALLQVASSLQSISLPFCEKLVDNALMGVLGRNLPHVVCLDVRGNSNLNSLTGWYDGRASATMKPQALSVLARYSSITKQSVEETKRIHPIETSTLICSLDGTGIGIGVLR